jgi:multidrug efflux pump subunit AcrA (membrane-fusion protein)
MLADPGSVLFLLGDLGELIVEVPLTEAMLGHVEAGQPVRITTPALDVPLTARLSRISPFLAEESFSTIGEIEVDNPGGRLRPGMFVTVDVLYGESERATLVPAAALWEDPESGVRGVFVVSASPDAASEEGGLSAPRPVEFRPVELLAGGRGAVGVAGVADGEWVVTNGQHLLARDDAATARVRATTWERVAELQSLQREDLLRRFLDEQQRYAATSGAEPPPSSEYLGENRGGSGPGPTRDGG